MFIELNKRLYEVSLMDHEGDKEEDIMTFLTSVAAAVNQSGNGTAKIVQQGYETLFVVSDGEDTDCQPIEAGWAGPTLRNAIASLALVDATLELYPRFGLEFKMKTRSTGGTGGTTTPLEVNPITSSITSPVPLLQIQGAGPEGLSPESVTGDLNRGRDRVLIPAGEFQMGSNDGGGGEKPVHTVHVEAFYMDVYEVTNALYGKFMQATGHSAPSYWNDSRFNAPNQPVVGVSWNDAVAYCQWAGPALEGSNRGPALEGSNRGKRLPTEAEWEKAARGGLVGKCYSWGDEEPDANRACFDRDWGKPADVGSFAPNGYGLYDMAGNVWEWCADWKNSGYYAKSPKQNPQGPGSGLERVLRGGSWSSYSFYLRVAARGSYGPDYGSSYNVGFRCAQDADA